MSGFGAFLGKSVLTVNDSGDIIRTKQHRKEWPQMRSSTFRMMGMMRMDGMFMCMRCCAENCHLRTAF